MYYAKSLGPPNIWKRNIQPFRIENFSLLSDGLTVPQKKKNCARNKATPLKINAPTQNASRIPSNQSIIPKERDDGCKNLSPHESVQGKTNRLMC